MNGRKMITLSFDDGVRQDGRLTEQLNRYGIKATFNLNTGLFGQTGTLTVGDQTVCSDRIAADEVAALYRGHEVAVHTVTHADLTCLDEEGILQEVIEDQQTLEKLTGGPVIGMAYPYGAVDELVMQTLERETTVGYARTTTATGRFELPRRFLSWHPTGHVLQENVRELVEAFDRAEPEQDMVLHLWGHAYELDVGSDGWERLDALLSRLAAVEQAEFLTNGEIFRRFYKR